MPNFSVINTVFHISRTILCKFMCLNDFFASMVHSKEIKNKNNLMTLFNLMNEVKNFQMFPNLFLIMSTKFVCHCSWARHVVLEIWFWWKLQECHYNSLFQKSAFLFPPISLLVGDDVGFETSIYNNTVCRTPNLERLAQRSVTLKHGYTSVSSCSPSRSAIMSGLPSHQNGIYGLNGGVHHFNAFSGVQSLPVILKPHGFKTGRYYTDICLIITCIVVLID